MVGAGAEIARPSAAARVGESPHPFRETPPPWTRRRLRARPRAASSRFSHQLALHEAKPQPTIRSARADSRPARSRARRAAPCATSQLRTSSEPLPRRGSSSSRYEIKLLPSEREQADRLVVEVFVDRAHRGLADRVRQASGAEHRRRAGPGVALNRLTQQTAPVEAAPSDGIGGSMLLRSIGTMLRQPLELHAPQRDAGAMVELQAVRHRRLEAGRASRSSTRCMREAPRGRRSRGAGSPSSTARAGLRSPRRRRCRPAG